MTLRIALDFDGTYTAAPELWNRFIETAQIVGAEITIVTFRGPDMRDPAMDWLETAYGIKTVFTDRVYKKDYCDAHGLEIDIWIDDMPGLIGHIEEPWGDEELAQWKEEVSETLSDRQSA